MFYVYLMRNIIPLGRIRRNSKQSFQEFECPTEILIRILQVNKVRTGAFRDRKQTRQHRILMDESWTKQKLNLNIRHVGLLSALHQKERYKKGPREPLQNY
jgi:hypothetical protein